MGVARTKAEICPYPGHDHVAGEEDGGDDVEGFEGGEEGRRHGGESEASRVTR